MGKLMIAIMGGMPITGYSGGRYCAWIMAEALAHQQNDVYLITNAIPECSQDFKEYPYHSQIHVILTNDFYDVPISVDKFDYVICIPAIDQSERFYFSCLDFAIQREARFSFINYETPNWYEKYTEMNRTKKDYEILKSFCKYGCLIVSLAKESQKYAEEFYDRYPRYTEFCVWSPPINSVVADLVREEKRNQILVFLRIKDKHKGGNDFLQLLGEHLRGMVCVCIVGNGEIDRNFLEEAEERAREHGIILRFEKSVDDYHKFQELKRSKLLLFPSHFEGYGYPPVEALYCGTACIVYDLPVLREISGDALVYCELDNIAMMRSKAAELLSNGCNMEPICVDTAEFTQQAEIIHDILEGNLSNPKLVTRRRMAKFVSILRKQYYTNIWNKLVFIRNKRKQAAIKIRRCRKRGRDWYQKEKKRLLPDITKYSIDHSVVISEQLDKKKERWFRLKKKFRGKQVYVWGYGRAYRTLYPKYQRRIRIHGIVDSDPGKIGSRDDITRDIIVQEPQILGRLDSSEIVVLISNKDYVDEIIERLKQMGVKEYHSLCMLDLNSTASKVYRIFRRWKSRPV